MTPEGFAEFLSNVIAQKITADPRLAGTIAQSVQQLIKEAPPKEHEVVRNDYGTGKTRKQRATLPELMSELSDHLKLNNQLMTELISRMIQQNKLINKMRKEDDDE